MVASQNGHLEAVITLIVSITEVNHTEKVINYCEHCNVQHLHVVAIGLSICVRTFECVHFIIAQFRCVHYNLC